MTQEALKTYTCVCGEVFTAPNKFNSHKNHCRTHIEHKYGSYEEYLRICTRNHELVGHKNRLNAEMRKKRNLQKWVSEQHKCEHCGKVLTKKYGSGRFCSRSCAASRPKRKETRALISSSILKTINERNLREVYRLAAIRKALKYGHTLHNVPEEGRCVVCGAVTKKRNGVLNKTCSASCYRVLQSQIAKSFGLGGLSTSSSYGKRGTYKGIHCDSTYELAFLVYCLDHNIAIVRNQRGFPYQYQGKTHKYYPDFYLPELDLYVETKGRDIGPVYEKIQGLKELNLNVVLLHREDLVLCFQHIVDTYKGTYFNAGSNNFYVLYDSV